MNISGPLWGGMVYDRLMAGAPYWMGAIILAAGLMLTRPARPD